MCKLPRCKLCGELLTSPINYMGEFYGYSCIKKIDRYYTKSKKKSNFKPCLLLENNFDYVRVEYLGKKYIEEYKNYFNFSGRNIACVNRYTKAIIQNNNIYYIDINKFNIK